MSEPKLNIKEESSAKKTRSPPKRAKVEQSVPKKKKLKTDADKAAEKAQHLRFGKAELTPDELSRLSKVQKREMYAAHAARSAVHREVDQYEDENVGVQALSESEKAAGNVRDISKSRYARKLKKKAKMQGKKGARTAKSSVQKPTAAQDAGASGTSEGGSNWLSRWKQRQEIHKSYYAAARSGTAAQTAGGKAASNGASAARSGVEQAVEKGKTAVSTALKGLANAAKSNAHVLVIVGVFLLLILMVMSAFSSCGILFSGGTQVSGQTIYSAEDRDIRGAEQDYKKLEKELDKKIKRTPTDHPGYNEYQYHLDAIEHDPWQLTSFLTTLYNDYTRSEVQGKLKETFKKQYKLTTWVEVQIRYKTVWVISPAGIPVPTQVPYEYRIFHTKLVNRGLEVVIREELDADQWKRYEIFQDTLGGRPYLFNGGLPPGGSDGSGAPGIDYQIPAEALTDEEFAAAIRYCHVRGVRVFLTLNTLVTDRELPAALDAARTACRVWVSRPGSDSARTASCDGTTTRSDSSSAPIPPAGYVRLSAAEPPPSVADAITNPLSPKLRFSCSSSSPPPTKISTAAAAAAIRGQYLRNTEIRGAGVFSSRSRRAHPSAGGVTSASRSAFRITSVQSLSCFII